MTIVLANGRRDTSFYDARKAGARCDVCPLKGRHTPVPPTTTDNARLIILGEGPGRREIWTGYSFVGPSGALLDNVLERAGWKGGREGIHISNMALCRGETDEEKERAGACCAPRLARELADIPKSVPVLALGKVAAKNVLGKATIMKVRGFVWDLPEVEASKIRAAERTLEKREVLASKNNRYAAAAERADSSLERVRLRASLAGRQCIPSIHPAFILRGSEGWAPALREDVKRMRRLVDRGAAFRKEDEGPYQLARTAVELRKMLATLRTHEVVVDVETDGVDPTECRMLMLGVSEVPTIAAGDDTIETAQAALLENDGQLVVLRHDIRTVLANPWKSSMTKVLADFLRDRVTVGHNFASYDKTVLERHGVKLGKIEDSLIALHAYASHLRMGLDNLASLYCDCGPWKIKFKASTAGGGEEKGDASKLFTLSNENIDAYNRADCALNAIAWRRMQPDLAPERAVYEHDMQLAEVCRQMQVNGFAFDTERRDDLSRRLKRRARYLLGLMREMTWEGFHPAKTADIREALYKKWKIPAIEQTPKGMPSTAVATLERLRGDLDTNAGRLADLILRWRGAYKTLSTFVDGVVLGSDGRVHPSWRAFGTVTGRLAARSPNLQNLVRAIVTDIVGKRVKAGEKLKDILEELGGDAYELETRVREQYIAKPGCVLVYFDLSQSEMRMAAYASGDPNFIRSCESGDIHTANAKILFPEAIEIFEKDPKGKGKTFRDVTKNAGFGILYDAEVDTIYRFLCAKGFGNFVTPESTKAMFDEIRREYKVYYEYCATNLENCRKTGVVRTIFTRRPRFLGRFPKPSDVNNCLDDQTEALTPRGWVNGRNLKAGEKLLTKNAETGKLEWHPITRMVRVTDYYGPLYEFTSASFSAMTTPQHRWLVSSKHGGPAQCRRTEELATGVAEYAIHRTGDYDPPAAKIFTDDFVELVGWVLTDGSIKPGVGGLVSVCQSERGNPHKVRAIDALFARLQANHSRYKGTRGGIVWCMHGNSNIARIMWAMFPDRILSPDFLMALPRHQLEILRNTMLLGDGSLNTRWGGHRIFSCRDERRADMFQMLCTMCGIATTRTWRKPAQPKKQYASIANRPKSRGIWIVSLLSRDKAQVIVHKRHYKRHKKPINQVRLIEGGRRFVWCPVVRNSYFVARRKGTVYITGNSGVQPNIADLMNLRFVSLVPRLPRNVRPVAQIHDACIFESPERLVDKTIQIIRETWDEEIVMPNNGLRWKMPIDLKTGTRWSELG